VSECWGLACKKIKGGVLLRRYESELAEKPSRSIQKVLPKVGAEEPDEEMYLRCFDDLYGFRGKNEGFSRHVYFLSPWEFVMLWKCVPLPKPPSPLVRMVNSCVEPNPAAECDDILFFPAGIPGDVDFRRRWYLRRRHRPMVPAPTNTPMPDQAKHAKKKFLLYSLYMRPWTLCPEWACTHVPCLKNLDIVPRDHMTQDLCNVLEAASVDLRAGVHELRNHELSWRC